MITLVGGKYDGKYLNRDPIPKGSTVAIIDDGDHEVYRMRADGCAYIDDPYAPMDSAAKFSDLT